MAIQRLDHFLVISRDLDRTRDFYATVLGLHEGPRPPFDFPGLWLYAGETACVHVRGVRDGDAEPAHTGAVDHVAFAAGDLPGMQARLREHGIEARVREVPGQGLTQLFVRDPDGVTIELNFPAPGGAPDTAHPGGSP